MMQNRRLPNFSNIVLGPIGQTDPLDFPDTVVQSKYQNAGKNLPPSVPDGSECKLRFGFVRKSVITL